MGLVTNILTIKVWLLFTISAGSYNVGTLTVFPEFPTQEACNQVKAAVDTASDSSITAACIEATVLYHK